MENIRSRIPGSNKLDFEMLNVPVMLTKEFEFEASHRLEPYDGRCAYVHGHSYKLQVSISGVPNTLTGLLIDFKELKTFVNQVMDDLDHNYLNGFFEINSTCENMVRWFWQQVSGILPANVALEEIRLWETSRSWCTLTRKMVEDSRT